MSDTATLADHIDQQVDAILGVWKSTVERYGNVPDANRLSNREFVDHVPELLDRLTDRLRGRDVDTALTGQKHGQHRWSQGYDIAEVVSELGHLRATLMKDSFAFARAHHFDLARIESVTIAISEVFEEATSESVRQFDEDSRSLSQSMLDAIEERRISAEGSRSSSRRSWTTWSGLGVGCRWTIRNVNREAERLQGFSEAETVGRVNILKGIPEYQLYRPDGSVYQFHELPRFLASHG